MEAHPRVEGAQFNPWRVPPPPAIGSSCSPIGTLPGAAEALSGVREDHILGRESTLLKPWRLVMGWHQLTWSLRGFHWRAHPERKGKMFLLKTVDLALRCDGSPWDYEYASEAVDAIQDLRTFY